MTGADFALFKIVKSMFIKTNILPQNKALKGCEGCYYILPAILGGAKCLANATVNIALCFFDFDIDNLFELAGER